MTHDPAYGDVETLDAVDQVDDYVQHGPRIVAAGAPVWLTGLATWLREGGLSVIEYDGWQTRARGSGAYSALPLCVVWHHTASGPSWDGLRDAQYIAEDDEDAPLANLYIERSGAVWVLAAGATNTNGKGQSLPFSRGIVPQDAMNTHAVGVEMGNDGLGEPWPQVQLDAMFTVSNIVNAKLGNIPQDLTTHNEYAPDRKIDPARADAVQGTWAPLPCNSSGSWDAASLRGEAARRGAYVPSSPTNGEEDGMSRQLVRSGREDAYNVYVCFPGGKYWLPSNEAIGQAQKDFGYAPIAVDQTWMEAAGPVSGPNPTSNPYGYWDSD